MKDLTNIPTEEIEKKLKTSRLVNGFLMGIVAMLALLKIMEFIETKEFDVMMVMPVVFLGAIIITHKNQKKMKAELDKRKSDFNS